jgi:hypothetical protein
VIVIAGIVALLGLGRYLRRRKSSSAQPTDQDRRTTDDLTPE